MLSMFVCTPAHVHGLSDRCWTAIVMDFNACWTALPTGGWHRLLAGHNCKVWKSCNHWQCNRGTGHDKSTCIGVEVKQEFTRMYGVCLGMGV